MSKKPRSKDKGFASKPAKSITFPPEKHKAFYRLVIEITNSIETLVSSLENPNSIHAIRLYQVIVELSAIARELIYGQFDTERVCQIDKTVSFRHGKVVPK